MKRIIFILFVVLVNNVSSELAFDSEFIAQDIKQKNSAKNSDDLPNTVFTWINSEEESKIVDSANVTLILSANEKIYRDYGMPVRPTIIIRCKDNKTDAYIVIGNMLDSNKSTIRLDSDKVFSMTMSKSMGGKALFFRKPISIINKMLGYNKLSFQFTPYNSVPQVITFNIEGLNEEVEPLRKSCNW